MHVFKLKKNNNNGPIYGNPAGAIIFTNAVGFPVNYVL